MILKGKKLFSVMDEKIPLVFCQEIKYKWAERSVSNYAPEVNEMGQLG
jgi:hypothetical protein